MLTLSLQPVVPTGFLPNGTGAHAVLSLPDVFFFGTELSGMKSNNSFFYFLFFVPPFPPIALVCAFNFLKKVPKKRDKC